MRIAIRRDDLIGALLLAALAIFVLAPLLTVIVWAFADQWRPPGIVAHPMGRPLLDDAARPRRRPAGAEHIVLHLADRDRRVGGDCAPGIVRLRPPGISGRKLFLLSFIAVNAFPRFPLYVSIAVVFLSTGLIGTVTGVVLIQLVFTLLFMIWIPTAAFKGVDRSIEEAARDVGASHLTVLVRITLPQVAPAIGAALLLTFMNTFYEVDGALLVGVPDVRTLPIVMLSLITGQIIVQYGAVLSVMLWVPSLILLLLARRLFDSRTFAAGLGV